MKPYFTLLHMLLLHLPVHEALTTHTVLQAVIMDQQPQTSASSRRRLAFMLDHLHEPMSAFMLPNLPVASLVALRACCQSSQCLIDHLPASVLQAAAVSLLPPNLSLKDSSSSLELQSLLRAQGKALRQMHAGLGAHLQLMKLPATMTLQDIHWAPDWPGSAMLARIKRQSDARSSFMFLDPQHITVQPRGMIEPIGSDASLSLMAWQSNTAMGGQQKPLQSCGWECPAPHSHLDLRC